MRTSISFLMTAFALILVLLSNSFALASGGDGSGGGNAVNGQLFDFYEGQTQPAMNKIIADYVKKAEGTLDFVDSKFIANFKEVILEPFKEKRIIVNGSPIQEKSCQNGGSLLVVNKTIVACQNRYEIRINAKVFLSLDERSRIGLIVHEGLLAMRLEEMTPDNKANIEYQIRELNRQIHDGSFLHMNQMQVVDALVSLGFDTENGVLDNWILRSEAVQAVAVLESLKLCSADDKMVLSDEELREARTLSEPFFRSHSNLARDLGFKLAMTIHYFIYDDVYDVNDKTTKVRCEALREYTEYWKSL